MSNINNKEEKKKIVDKDLIKNGIGELKFNQWKFIFISIYFLITIPFIFKVAFPLVSMIPDSIPLGLQFIDNLTGIITKAIKFGIDIFILFLEIMGFLQVIVWIGKYHFKVPQDEKFLDTKLVNRQGQPPEYRYKYKDTTKKHGEVLYYDKKRYEKRRFYKRN